MDDKDYIFNYEDQNVLIARLKWLVGTLDLSIEQVASYEKLLGLLVNSWRTDLNILVSSKKK